MKVNMVQVVFVTLVAFSLSLGCSGTEDDPEADTGIPEDSGEEQVATGEACPTECAERIEERESSVACDACEGGRCYQSFDETFEPYCTVACEERADCSEFGDLWRCSNIVNVCVDLDREYVD